MHVDHVDPHHAHALAAVREAQRMTDTDLVAHVRMLRQRMNRTSGGRVEAVRREMFDGGPPADTAPETLAYRHAFHAYQDARAVLDARRAHA